MSIRPLIQAIKETQLIVQQSSVLHSMCELVINPAFAQASNHFDANQSSAVILLHQEPITQSLHLPYKPLESTLSDEKLFIKIVFVENLSCSNA